LSAASSGSRPGQVLRSLEQGLEPRQKHVEPVPDEADHAADAPIDQACDAGRPVALRLGEYSPDAGDAVMHRLDQVDDASDSVDGQPVEPAKIGSTYPEVLDQGDQTRLGNNSLQAPLYRASALTFMFCFLSFFACLATTASCFLVFCFFRLVFSI
jgi:hypothetical protein